MSYTNIDNDLITDRNLNSNEFRIFIYLLRNWNEKYGYSFPLREQIQEGTGISLKTINKVLNSLEEKGYITRAKHKTKTGWNNIYYIHKYLVVSKKDTPEAPADESKAEDKQDQSSNELLIKEKAKLVRQLKAEELEEINQLDTELLSKAIDRANFYKPNGYHIGYILSCYDSVKDNPTEPQREAQKNKSSNNSKNNIKDNTGTNRGYVNNNYPVKTKYHDTFNEHFRKYTEVELEEKLLKIQSLKRLNSLS